VGMRGTHGKGRAVGLTGGGDRANQDLHARLGPQTQSAPPDIEQAGRTGANDLQTATAAHAQFRHAANPSRLAVYLSYIGPCARGQEFDW